MGQIYDDNDLKREGRSSSDAGNGLSLDGNVRVTLDKVPRKAVLFAFLRIPEWCEKATLRVNGQPLQTNAKANSYVEVNRGMEEGDVVELVMDMPVRLLGSLIRYRGDS